MNVANALAQSGLDEKESKIYLALLQLQQATVLELSKKADIKRTTVYVILDQLEKNKLVNKVSASKTTLYKPNSPARLIEMMNQKRALLERVMPSLLTIYKNDPSIPSIKIQKGIDAVKNIYKEMVSGAYGSIYRFGDMYSFQKTTEFDQHSLVGVFKDRGVSLKDLLGNTEYEKGNFKNLSDNYESRHYNAPKDTFTVISNNKVYIFSVGTSSHVMVIDDKAVYEAYYGLIEMAWVSAEE